jgi:plastocyanin
MPRLALGMLVLVLLAAAPAAHAADASITASNSFSFVPNDVTIGTGEKVTVTNPSSGFHNVRYDDVGIPAGCPENGSPTMWTCERTFQQAGTYHFHCDVHGLGMSATVHVTPVVYTWNGADGDNWTDTSKWLSSPDTAGTYPGGHSPTDEVVIDNGTSPTLDESLTVGALTLDTGGGRKGSGNLTIAGGDVSWGTAALAGSGTTKVGSDASVTLTNTLTLADTAILENGGTLTLGQGSSIADNSGGLGLLHNLDMHLAPRFGMITVTADAATPSVVSVPTQNEGIITVPTGNGVVFDATGDLVQPNGFTHVNGTLTKTNGTFKEENGLVTGAGTIVGTLANIGGVVEPGVVNAAPGTLTVSSYSQGPNGALGVDLSDVGFDVLAVGGVATLGGNLEIFTSQGFNPALSDSFPILTAGDRQGVFGFLSPPFVADKSWIVEYGLTSATLTVAQAPVNSAPPSISGSAVAGQTLTCSTGTWTGSPSFAFQWLRDGVPISGATNADYLIVVDDLNHPIACRVTATNAIGSTEATSAAVTATAEGPGGGGTTCCTAPRQTPPPSNAARACAPPVAGFAACIQRPPTFLANGCVPRGATTHRFVVKLRKSSRKAKRAPRITLVTFTLDGKKNGSDKKAPFAALVKGASLAPGAHRLAADVRLQAGKKKARKKVSYRFTACA